MAVASRAVSSAGDIPRSTSRGKRVSISRLMTLIAIFGWISYSIGSWKLSSEILLPDSSKSTSEACPPRISSKRGSSDSSSSTDFGFLCQDPAVSFLQIAKAVPITEKKKRPRILCLVLTQSKNHATRMRALADTWGRKCDTLIAASDKTDPALHTYRIESMTGYWGIWDKLMQTLKQIVEGGGGDTTSIPPSVLVKDYDWILKADDDTYVIMENLQAFLANVTNPKDEPRIYGRTMAWPRLKRFQDMQGWFDKESPPANKQFGQRFYSKLGESQTLRFSHGGPGYVMNRKYAETLVQAYFNASGNAVKGEIAEDIANAATMLYHGIQPESTFDLDTGRERMHPESPQTMYANPIWLDRMHHGMRGSVKGEGEQCCSPTSISYHYVPDFQMRLLDYQLYHCPH
jgi:glycoprotein-N-acetylgalactosamine 3-beta-galactosyltransferase